MSSSVRCASAASTSSCMPLTISAIALGLGPRGLLAHQRLALGLPAQALAHVAHEAGHQHLAARRHARDRRFRREAGPVAALELDSKHPHGRRPRRRAARARRSSWRSRHSAGMIRRAHAACRSPRPTASRTCARRRRSRSVTIAVAVEGDERVRGAVEHQPGARLALLRSASAIAGLGAAPRARATSMREISRPAISGVPTASSQRTTALDRVLDRPARRRRPRR